MIGYVFNLSNIQHSYLKIGGDGLDDAQESLEQLVGYKVKSRPSMDLVPLQTVRTSEYEHIDLDEEGIAKVTRGNPLRPEI